VEKLDLPYTPQPPTAEYALRASLHVVAKQNSARARTAFIEAQPSTARAEKKLIKIVAALSRLVQGMAREKAVATTKRGQTSGGKTAPGKKQGAKRKGAMVLAAAAVDRGAAALARKRKAIAEEEEDELDQEERGEGGENEEEAMEEEMEEGEEEEGEGSGDIEEQENQGKRSSAQNKRRPRSKVFHVALLLLPHTLTDIICTSPACQNSF